MESRTVYVLLKKVVVIGVPVGSERPGGNVIVSGGRVRLIVKESCVLLV